jgi:replicative DNA helicase
MATAEHIHALITQANGLSIVPPAEWEPPVPLTEPARPPFPTNHLPASLADMVRGIAGAKQVSEDLAAMQVLGAANVPLNGRVVVARNADHIEPVGLFLLSATGPSEGKNQTQDPAFAPVFAHQAALRDKLSAAVEQRSAERRVLARRIEATEKELANAKVARDGRLAGEAELRALIEKLTELPEQHVEQLTTSNITPEALPALIQNNGGRVAIVSAEGGIFDIFAGLYNDKTAVLDTLLEGYSGGRITVNRRSGDPIHIERAYMAMVVTVQPITLERIGQNRDFAGRGLLARCLISQPPSLAGYRSARNSTPLKDGVRSRYETVITALLEECALPDDGGPIRITVSRDAESAWLDWYDAIQVRMRSGGEFFPDAIKEWAGKLAGNTLRIAATLHSVEQVERLEGIAARSITHSTMEAAVALARDYFAPQMLAAFTVMQADPPVRLAHRVLKQIEARHVRTFDRRDMQQWIGNKSAPEIQAALEVLTDHDYLRPVNERKTRYEVNPGIIAEPSTSSTDQGISCVNVEDVEHFARNSDRSPNGVTALMEVDQWQPL